MQGPWNSTQWETACQPKRLGNLYRYNGKELNTDLGLDWYDYGEGGMMRWWGGLRRWIRLQRSLPG